jgi:hypothetical protein
MSRSSAILTQCYSSLSFKQAPTFPVLCIGIIVLDLQSAKILSRFLHPLISPKILFMHRNNIFSLFLSNLFRSNLSSNYALTFKLGKNLSNIPRFILLKQKFPLILPLPEKKSLRSYLFSSNPVSFLAQSFTSQVEYCALQQQIYA